MNGFLKLSAYGLILTAAFGGAAIAQSDRITDPVKLSLAAGYKATFTCSSYFNAHRSVEQIAGDELHRIYPGYRDALAQLPDAVIDEEKKTVSVHYLPDFPPRIALKQGAKGCMQLPAGMAAEVFSDVSGSTGIDRASARARDLRKAWPQGDKAKGRLFTKTSAGKALRDQIEVAFDHETYGAATETTAVLVIRNGEIIGEKYRKGFDKHTPQRTWSVAKSIAASIIGAAIEAGHIELKAPTELDHWSSAGDPRQVITLENLLHMASGLDNGPRGNRTDDIYFGGGRVVDHAQAGRLIATPGTRWFYANNDTMLAMRVLREKIADDGQFHQFAFRNLLDKIGMHHTFLETDWNGDFILSSQVYTTARDLGRLGLLYLGDGVWNGERIFPAWWSDYVVAPAPAQPPLRANGSKRFGYGAQFWLLGGFADLPQDTYAALGNRGQHLVIIPSRQLIIVRRGFDDNGGAQFDIAQFASDVVKSLE